MTYSLEVICENSTNYFVSFYEDKRFLFRRINPAVFISQPETKVMDSLEIQRNGSIILSANCYRLLGKIPVYWIEYSEIPMYRVLSNISSPHQIFFAEDFTPGDIIFSNVNAEEVKGKSYASLLSFFNCIDTSMKNLGEGLKQSNLNGTVTCNGSPVLFERKKSSRNVLGIKTYIVPIEFC